MTEEIILETPRLRLRKLTQEDLGSLKRILQDKEVMTAYEGPFDDDEVQSWLDRQLARYQTDGIGLYAVILKESGELIGQCGLTMQEIPGRRVVGVGYLFCKEFWHQGYASEAAIACRDYAFKTLQVPEVFSIIRDSNLPSQRVAERNGMVRVGEFDKHYRGVTMPHYIFSIKADKESLS